MVKVHRNFIYDASLELMLHVNRSGADIEVLTRPPTKSIFGLLKTMSVLMTESFALFFNNGKYELYSKVIYKVENY